MPDGLASDARAREAAKPWDEETVEMWLPEKRLVFVFRYVPTYATDFSQNHPDLAEWTRLLLLAAEGLEGPSIAHRNVYDADHFGVEGHRPMTDAEAAAHLEDLRRRAEWQERAIAALTTDA